MLAIAHRLPVLAFVWEQFGDYHLDRLTALGEMLCNRAEVVGLEIATSSETYDWKPSGNGKNFIKKTLFPGTNVTSVNQWRMFCALLHATLLEQVDALFISGYEKPSHLFIAIVMRLRGRKVFVMNDSKFDDKPRRLCHELLKVAFMLPYNGGFASGRRARDYMQFLGLTGRPIVEGYDAVGLARLRALASSVPPPDWKDRPFLVVARFVHKKNLGMALAAFRGYHELEDVPPRRLRICGTGPLEAELRARAVLLGVAGEVDFLGSLPQQEVASEMARALCLLLPSREEQWGLVVNEGLAFGLPMVISDNVGARDTLVATLDNGFVLDPDDLEGWIAALQLLGCDEKSWIRFHANAQRRAPQGDVSTFVDGCLSLAGLNDNLAGK